MEQKFVEQVHGILVHELPRECRREALEQFLAAKLSVRRDSQDELGMRIFFNIYDCVRDTILWRRVMVRGKSYDIYPLVTNLTVHGIRRYANEMKIRRLMKPYGPVIDIYVVKKEHTQYRTYITEDYRVILDVPEVLANYHLNPVVLPDVKQKFPVSFFCRLCRQDGHRQYQCQAGTNGDFAKSALTERCVGYEECQSTCPESDVSEVDHSDGDFRTQIHSRKSSMRTTPASYSGYGNSTPKSRSSGIRQNSDHGDPRSHQKDYATLSSRPSTSRGYHSYTQSRNSRSDSHSSEGRASQNRSLGQKYFGESSGKSAPSTRYRRRMDKGASEDIRIAGKKNEITKKTHENIESSKRGEALLQPDRSRCKRHSTKSHKQSNNSARDSIGAKMDRLECQSGGSSSSSGLTEDAPSQPSRCNTASSTRMESRPVEDSKVDHPSKTQNGDPSTRKPKKRRRRPLFISRGVSAIIKRVQGVLNPVLLENFLKQALGRRKVVDMARGFTSDIRGLINQLKDVENSYYTSGKKKGEDYRVIDYIKRLHPRLERDISADPHRHRKRRVQESSKFATKEDRTYVKISLRVK